jgi:hypothetical protein
VAGRLPAFYNANPAKLALVGVRVRGCPSDGAWQWTLRIPRVTGAYLRDIADPRCFEVRSVDAHIADAPFANFNVTFGEAANA